MSKILIVAPHPDDEIIGCGGAIQHHVQKGDSVFIHIIGNRVYDHVEDESYVKETFEQAKQAAQMLGVEEVFFSNLRDEQFDKLLIDVIVPIEEVTQRVEPDIMYIPHGIDTDQDHRAVADACKVACRSRKKVLAYEILGPTKSFEPNYFVDIEKYFSRKIEALKLYKSEVHPFPHPRSPEALEALAKVRGVEAGINLAEAFVLKREVVG